MSRPLDVFRIRVPDDEAEIVIAELHALGTLGIEERPEQGELHAYFEPDPRIAARVLALANPERGIVVAPPERMEPVDWEQEWRRGLAPRQVAGVWIRPSWCESQGTPEIVIDPKQAFGSGEHATTRLALGLLVDALAPGDRVLDVGTGSGILGLAALRQGAARAVGVEIDPVACENAVENAERNGLALEVVCGDLDAIDPAARFEVGVANMILRELRECVPALLPRCTRAVVLSGYLEGERSRIEDLLAGTPWRTVRETSETQSGDAWCARWLVRAREA